MSLYPTTAREKQCASYDSQRQNFLDYVKQILTLETFEGFNYSNIFNKVVFCLGEKEGMLINDECVYSLVIESSTSLQYSQVRVPVTGS